MSKRVQVRVAAILLSLAILAWVAIGLLLFYVPSLETVWDDLDQPLSAGQQRLVTLSAWLGGRLRNDQVIPGAMYIFGPLVALTAGALVWRIWATLSLRRRPT